MGAIAINFKKKTENQPLNNFFITSEEEDNYEEGMSEELYDEVEHSN